jgi:hypothetical protein
MMTLLEDVQVETAGMERVHIRMWLLMTDYIHANRIIVDTQAATIERLRAELAAIRDTITAECNGRYTRPFDRIRAGLHPTANTIDTWVVFNNIDRSPK